MSIIKKFGLCQCLFLCVVLLSINHVVAADKKQGYVISEPTGCKVWDSEINPGDSVRWNGACRNGLAEGEGSGRWGWVTDAGESQYAYYDVITMRAGKRTGYGEVRYYNGETYKGEHKNGVREGRGVYRWPDGRHYSGQWKDYSQDGQGTLTWPSGKQFSGQWKAGKYNGQGTMVYSNGVKYVGPWKAGKRHGDGIIFSNLGAPSAGAYVNEKKHGQWIQITGAGKVYVLRYNNGVVSEGKANVSDSIPHFYNTIINGTYSLSSRFRELAALLKKSEFVAARLQKGKSRKPLSNAAINATTVSNAQAFKDATGKSVTEVIKNRNKNKKKPARPSECDALLKEVKTSKSSLENKRYAVEREVKQLDQLVKRYNTQGSIITIRENTLRMCLMTAYANCTKAANDYDNAVNDEKSMYREYETAKRNYNYSANRYNKTLVPRHEKLYKSYQKKCE